MTIGSMLFLAVFSSALATAALAGDQQAQESQNACVSDAMTVCGQFIPDRERVAHCLLSNRTRVSGPCRVALTHWRG